MSLSRKLLEGLGLTKEQVDAIIEAHTGVVDGLISERDRLKAQLSEFDGHEDLQKAFNDLQKEYDSLKQEHDSLKQEYEGYKSEQAQRTERNAKETAYKSMLMGIGIPEKRASAILRVVDMTDVKINKDGTLKDLDKISEEAKKEWSDFIATESVEGVNTPQPPSNVGGITRDDILKIEDAAERQQKIAENHELFGF